VSRAGAVLLFAALLGAAAGLLVYGFFHQP